MFTYTILILLLPFLSFLLLGLFGNKLSHRAAGLIGTASLGAVFLLSCYAAYEYFYAVGRGSAGIYEALVP